jgi:hypothetical protein
VARESRRANLARFLTRTFAANDVTDRAVAALTGAVAQHVAQWRDPDAVKSLGVADAQALPEVLRVAIAEWLLPGFVVIRLPDVSPSASVAQALHVQRETSEVVSAHLAAAIDGVLSRSEATPLRRDIWQAVRALLSVDLACERAEREGVVSVAEVH